MTNYRTRIQNFLRSLCLAGTYYIVAYHDGVAEPVIDGTTETIAPTTIVSNETGGSFQTDIRQGRHERLERSRWTFQVRMTFKSEVNSENFEEQLMNCPRIEADKEHKNVKIVLLSATYDHPPQQSPSNGSSIVFEFDAQVGRA